jgi:hypothetical protein
MANIEIKIGADTWRGTATKVVAPTATLTATPATVQPGQPVTLIWATQNATTVTLDGQAAPSPSGTKADTPTATKTYRLVATGQGGTKEATAAVTVTPVAAGRRLLGGWRLNAPAAVGTLAVDWATRRAFVAGPASEHTVLEFALPANPGAGADPSAWPLLTAARVIPGWWPSSEGYCNGLCWWQNDLWALSRVFYDQAPPEQMTLFALGGARRTLSLPRQMYSGFVKGLPNSEPLLGCGGYISGQGTASGPTLAKMDGTRLLEFGWPADPGADFGGWDARAPREPNYSYAPGHDPSWVCWPPRVVNGKLEGRWACEEICGGGLRRPEGVTYWPVMGTGQLFYGYQTRCFVASDAALKTYEYRLDPQTNRPAAWKATDLGLVKGQDMDAQGREYLSVTGFPWDSSPAIHVYG